MHRFKLAAALFVVLLCSSVQAVNDRDDGIYLVVNTKGEVTAKAFRLAQRGNDWIVEDRKPDGSWSDITCESECKMTPSIEADIQKFFPPQTLAQIVPDCIHSRAFAFCGYALKNDATFRGYLFVVLTERQPITLRLARVVPDKKPGS